MRDQDLEALHRGYEALNRGELIGDMVHPEIRWSPGRDAPEAGDFIGRDGFVEFVSSWSESFDGFHLEPEQMTVAGDSVIVTVRQSGRGRGSGVQLDIKTVHVWTISDGLAVAWAAYRNRREALAATGMSAQAEMVCSGYEAFNRGDVEASLTILHPEIVWHTYIVPGPGGGTYHGYEGVRELWSDAQRIFGGFRNIPEQLFEAGNRVVAFVRVEGVGTKSGVAVTARIAHLHTFQDGRVIRVESFEDRAEALRTAGINA
jgi:ketosteroid isomerase-like protein